MKSRVHALALSLLACMTAVHAVDFILVRILRLGPGALRADVVQNQDDSQKCSGMYSKKAWGGKVDPFIQVKFDKFDLDQSAVDPVVSVVVWEWRDSDLIGKASDLPTASEGVRIRSSFPELRADDPSRSSTFATTKLSAPVSARIRTRESGSWPTMLKPPPRITCALLLFIWTSPCRSTIRLHRPMAPSRS